MAMNDLKDEDFDALFAAARLGPQDVSPDLMARVLDQGLAEQARQQATRTQPPGRPAAAPGLGLLDWLRAGLGSFGGWQGASGLVAVTAIGVWLGFSPPSSLAALADGVLGTALATQGAEVDQLDLMPSFDSYLAEG